MKSAFRNAYFTLSHSLIPSPNISVIRHLHPFLSHSRLFPLNETFRSFSAKFCSSSSSFSPPMATGGENTSFSSFSLEKQFDDFRSQLEESGGLRERIRAVVMEIGSSTRLMHAGLLLVHQSRPVPEVLEKAKAHIGVLKDSYSQLAEILRECPGQYYRYHGDWQSETQTVVSLLAFMHWLETGELLLHPEAEEKLGLNNSEFGLDTEDYLTGLCFMSNDMPRYLINQVTAGDYDCPRKVLNFMTELHAAFRMLNLRNDFLRRKFDGMKYDLRRVEEVYYDVKIRGLSSNSNSKEDQDQK